MMINLKLKIVVINPFFFIPMLKKKICEAFQFTKEYKLVRIKTLFLDHDRMQL